MSITTISRPSLRTGSLYGGASRARTFRTSDLGLVTVLQHAHGCVVRLEFDGSEQFQAGADFDALCASLMA